MILETIKKADALVFPSIEFNESAFKHGVTKVNILYAMWHPLCERQIELYANKWMLIGYDTAGNLIEVAYNMIDDDTVNVFHAMPCRKKYISLLKPVGEQ